MTGSLTVIESFSIPSGAGRFHVACAHVALASSWVEVVHVGVGPTGALTSILTRQPAAVQGVVLL
jgi:hypothetical protein